MARLIPDFDVKRVALVLTVCLASVAGGFLVGMWLGS